MKLEHKEQIFVLHVQDTFQLFTRFKYQTKNSSLKQKEIGNTLIEHVKTRYCVPDCIMMDYGSVFMVLLINYSCNKLDILKKDSSSL